MANIRHYVSVTGSPEVGAVIKMILAGALVLGVVGPMGGLARDGGDQVTIGKVGSGPSWNDANAKMRFVRIAKNAIVFYYSKKVVAVGEKVRPRKDRECFLGLARKGVNRAFRKDGGNPFWDFGAIVNAGTTIHNNGVSDIASLHYYQKKASITANTTFKIKSDSASLLRLTQKVGPSRFVKSSPYKNNTNYAQYHADNGGSAHDVGPIGGLALSHKVLLVALVSAAFLAIFCNAIRLFIADKPHAALPYLLVGVSGIFTSIGVGLPLIHGVP
jgi:hypothetical protein